MRNFLTAMTFLAASLLALPADAFERMQRAQCRDALVTIAEVIQMSDRDIQDAARARHVVTPDGWCRIFGNDPVLGEAPFATLDWRAEQIGRFLRDKRPPEAIQLRITDLRADEGDPELRGATSRQPPLDVDLILRHVQDTRQLIIEELRVSSDAGDELYVTAILERVDFSSAAMAQVSLGSVALGRFNARARLNGWVENQVLPDLEIEGDPQQLAGLVRSAVSQMPAHLFDEVANANIDAFIGDLPAPRGVLEVGLRSDRGVMFSGVAAVLFLGQAMGGEDPLETILDGLHIDVRWTPDANQTE